MDLISWQWILIIASSLVLFFISPWSKTTDQFFKARGIKNNTPSLYTLTASLVISWIFAKSITNAADLGNSYGFPGGFFYAAYYLSFIVCGWIIYQLRKLGYSSIHHFLKTKFGRSALVFFSILICFRLFNEVWSNTMVIGSYFGDQGSTGYYASILVFTALTLAYTIKGGLKSSLLTDVIQLALFAVLLAIILFKIFPVYENPSKLFTTGTWHWSNGLNLLGVVFIQIFSYPFHDPVMTDRGFVSDEKVTLKSYFLATFIGIICISLFSLVGVHAKLTGLENPAAVSVAKYFGPGLMLVMNVIMVTSAASTLDSTFSSFSKLAIQDLKLGNFSVKSGRISMLILGIAGTVPILFSPTILSATTISGTMVLGLAPVFLLKKMHAPKLSFHLSVGAGVLVGMLLAFGVIKGSWAGLNGPYADLLFANILGTFLTFSGYLLPVLWKKSNR
ncbi:sodium:solute symporter family transporter [Luteibaculum oceani]|uniref:Sodium:solute symporter n=1 Tax=Luteibaculum oceani TaxID=1294296 RepID=A0A5C6VA51_9FLAO|nr:sodium:solute symporter [Luteibaculum oceani]TXC82079.1 sodium:solute symporter [Luteibaculum oceani]